MYISFIRSTYPQFFCSKVQELRHFCIVEIFYLRVYYYLDFEESCVVWLVLIHGITAKIKCTYIHEHSVCFIIAISRGFILKSKHFRTNVCMHILSCMHIFILRLSGATHILTLKLYSSFKTFYKVQNKVHQLLVTKFDIIINLNPRSSSGSSGMYGMPAYLFVNFFNTSYFPNSLMDFVIYGIIIFVSKTQVSLGRFLKTENKMVDF